jgi:hypothetical protein
LWALVWSRLGGERQILAVRRGSIADGRMHRRQQHWTAVTSNAR